MEFNKVEKRTYTQEEVRKTNEFRASLSKTVLEKKEEHKALMAKPDFMQKQSKAMADWLERELRNLAASSSPMARAVFVTLTDHITSDAILKAFQLQTLEKLTNTYIKDQGFQWFINTTYPSLNLVGMDNPILLNHDMFVVHEGIVQDQHPETLSRLSTEEKAFNATIGASEGGFYFLLRRPWLSKYLLAILYYRTYYSLEWAVKVAEEIRNVGLNNDKPDVDPNTISTDIPHPVITPGLQLADIGL